MEESCPAWFTTEPTFSYSANAQDMVVVHRVLLDCTLHMRGSPSWTETGQVLFIAPGTRETAGSFLVPWPVIPVRQGRCTHRSCRPAVSNQSMQKNELCVSGPICVERTLVWSIPAAVGVCSERIALCLREILRQATASKRIEPGKASGYGRQRNPMLCA